MIEDLGITQRNRLGVLDLEIDVAGSGTEQRRGWTTTLRQVVE
jgi:hypothetical protein